MQILITGINGLIGWNLFSAASKRFPTLGTYRKFHKPFLKANCLKVDLDDEIKIYKLLKDISPEIIIHSRVMCDLDVCEEHPDMAMKINAEGTKKLLSAAMKLSGLKKFVLMSTEHVFNGDKGNYSEDDFPCPKHAYGRSRAEAEKLVLASGIPFLIVRPGIAVGESVQGTKGTQDFVFSRICQKKPIHLFTDEWRSPIHVNDLVEKTLELILFDKQGIFHIASKHKYSRFELGRVLAKRNSLSTENVFPRFRSEDKWSHIRVRDLTLTSKKGTIFSDF